jgi:hypothetical protein
MDAAARSKTKGIQSVLRVRGRAGCITIERNLLLLHHRPLEQRERELGQRLVASGRGSRRMADSHPPPPLPPTASDRSRAQSFVSILTARRGGLESGTHIRRRRHRRDVLHRGRHPLLRRRRTTCPRARAGPRSWTRAELRPGPWLRPIIHWVVSTRSTRQNARKRGAPLLLFSVVK